MQGRRQQYSIAFDENVAARPFTDFPARVEENRIERIKLIAALGQCLQGPVITAARGRLVAQEVVVRIERLVGKNRVFRRRALIHFR